MTTAQTFLFFLLLLGVVAALLRLASQQAPALPYQVVLAASYDLVGGYMGYINLGHAVDLESPRLHRHPLLPPLVGEVH